MDVGVWMSAGALEHKLECGSEAGNSEATWNTRRVPKALTPSWSNRLFVACEGCWRGWFPLAGEVLWNPEDRAAPCALIFDARGWTAMAPAPVARFRGWRYLREADLGIPAGGDGSSPGSSSGAP